MHTSHKCTINLCGFPIYLMNWHSSPFCRTKFLTLQYPFLLTFSVLLPTLCTASHLTHASYSFASYTLFSFTSYSCLLQFCFLHSVQLHILLMPQVFLNLTLQAVQRRQTKREETLARKRNVGGKDTPPHLVVRWNLHKWSSSYKDQWFY